MRRSRTDRLGDAGKAVGAKQFGKTFLYVGHETRPRKDESRIELHETSARANLLVRLRGAGDPPDADQRQPASVSTGTCRRGERSKPQKAAAR